jgi:hypothetical protein
MNYIIILIADFIGFRYQKYNIKIGIVIESVRVERLYNINIIY